MNMKNLLLLLLVANILYFLWSAYTEKPAPQGVLLMDRQSSVPQLSLATPEPSAIESPEGENILQSDVVETAVIQSLPASTGRSCVSVGPFRTRNEADETAASAGNFVSAIRETEGQVFIGHWVRIDGLADRAEGNEMLTILQDGGMGDAYLTADENDQPVVSLGFFGEMSGAERVELQANSLGLQAAIVPRMSDAQVFFVDLALPPNEGAGALIERYGEEKVLLRDLATCPDGN